MYISPYCRQVLVTPNFMKFGIRGQLADVITYVKFLVDRFMGYGVLTSPKLPFPIDLLYRPYNSVALPCDTVKQFNFCRFRASAYTLYCNWENFHFWSRDLYLHVILHLHSEICINRRIWRRYVAKNGFQYGILNLKKLDYVYQIWSKSDNSRLRYWDKAIFKMAAIRHLEFAKIAVLVTENTSGCELCSKFRVDRPIWRRDIAKNDFQYGVSPPSWIWKI